MNAFMNVQVRIITAQAQQRIRQLEGELRRLDRSMGNGATGARNLEGGFARAMTAGTKFGNQLQWTGRQLQYNFAMPIALAGAAAVNFALDNERAMVRVEKVYGDAGQTVEDFGGEVEALERNFRALSNHFGVHRSEVIKIAGDWAAAGATGVALAKATKLTLETMILGEIEAAEATENLLAVQGQYNLSVGELSQTMDTLNMIENETDVSMRQLLQSMARAAGTARQAGVDVQYLAAMTAALVPEAGSAANAGNGLKTIISRLLAPTEDAAAVLAEMGMSMEDLDWQSLNVQQRLETLADAYMALPEGQRAVVGEYVAGRYQITRFSQLMADIASEMGDYEKAVKASGDQQANYNQRVRELNAVLDSNPQKMKQVRVILENVLADVIQPMLPFIVYLAQRIAALGQAFANLDPSVQMLIGAFLAFLLVFGPLLRYLGSSLTLFATMGAGARALGGGLLNLARRFLLLGPAAVAGNAAAARATAAGTATQAGILTRFGGAMTRFWIGLRGWMVRTTIGQWVGINAATAAGQAAQKAQQNRLNIFTIGNQARTNSRLSAMWQAFWANQNRTEAQGTAQSETYARVRTARAHGYYAQQTAVANAANSAMAAGTVATTSTMTSTWLATYSTMAAGQATVVEGYIVGDVALRETSLATTRLIYANWVSYWTQAIAGQRMLTTEQLAILTAGGTAQQAYVAAYLAQIQALYAAWVASVLAWYRGLGTGWLAITTGTATADLAIRRGYLAAVLADLGAFGAAVFAFYRGLGTGLLAITASSASAEVAIRVTALQTQIAAEGAYWAQRKAINAAGNAWINGEDAGWYVIAGELNAASNTTLVAQDRAGYAARAAVASGFRASQTAAETLYATGRVVQGERLAIGMAAVESTQQATSRGRWASFWAWMTAGHSAWAIRIAGISQIGFGKMGMVETAYMTASRARWTAYWMTVATMQRGAAARMVATDAATKMAMGGSRLFRFMLNPWVLVTLAIIGVVYHFRDEIVEAFHSTVAWVVQQFQPLVPFFDELGNRIIRAFYSLPEGVQSAMLAVVRVVQAAAMKVYELFSYLNPFARHSPSLVENVTNGSNIVAAQYARMGSSIAVSLQTAAGHLATFKRMAANLGIDEWSDKRLEIAEGLPQMLPLFNTLTRDLKGLNATLAAQGAAVDRQQAVVDRWADSLERANTALDTQQEKLGAARDRLQELEDAYASHEQTMRDYADAPIQGMGAMADKIFENEMAQKKLRLEIMDWEDANGSIDEVRDRLAMLQGDIEKGQAEAADLRSAGAGSDVLGPIEAEIAAMEAQAKATQDAIDKAPITQMQKDLERLERAGQRLDLENSIEFDPLLREIDKLANAQKELTYEEIVAGINRERAAMEQLAPQIERATEAVKEQEAAVKQAELARDAIQDVYDRESEKLDGLRDSYEQTEKMIRDIEAALNDVAVAAREANEATRAAKGPDERYAVEKFRQAAPADFADVGGTGNVPREFPEIEDQSALIDEMTRQLTADTAALFGEFDMLGPIKKAWERATTWLRENVGPYLEPIGTTIREQWGRLFDGEGVEMSGILAKVESGLEPVVNAGRKARDLLGMIWRLIAPDIKEALAGAWEAIQNAFGDIGREVGKYSDLWEPLKRTAESLWIALKGAFYIGMAALLVIWKVMWSVLAEVVGPIIDLISDVIENALQIIRGVIQVVMSIILGDWKLAWEGVKNIVVGVLDMIWDILKGGAKIIWGVVKGIVQAIVGFFMWLYDELVGHSIVPDIVDGIRKVFESLASIARWIWNNVLKPIANFFEDLWNRGIKPALKLLVDGIQAVWNGLKSAAGWIWTNVLQPIVNAFKDLWSKGGAGIQWTLGLLKAGVQAFWNGLKTIGSWIWTNVLQPIVNAFKDLWSGAGKGISWALGALKTGWDRFWNGLKVIGTWVWNNVLKPVVDKFTALWPTYLLPVFNRLLRGIGNIWNAVGEGIAAGVNIGISAINKLIDAINWVGKNVPGLNFSITPIGKVTWAKWSPPQFETGGVLPKNVGEGFATRRARAIVGEGNSQFPEYVIPTDPRHRQNALRLYGDLGKNLGMDGAVGGFGFDIPGVDIAGAIQSAGSAIRQGAVSAALAGPMKLFNAAISKVPNRPVPMKDFIMEAKKNIQNWAKGIEDKMPSTPPPGQVGKQPGGIGAGWSAIDNWLAANGNVHRVITSTFRPGDPGRHGSGQAVDYSVGGHGNRGYNHAGLRAIFDALLPIGGNLSQLILAGAPFNILNGREVPGYAWGQPGRAGNHWNHVHAALAEGGILQGPVHALMGEAGPEVVTPLAPLWNRLDRIESMTAQQSSSRGDTIININGDLSFPNIENGDDAEAFIRNLEIMASR